MPLAPLHQPNNLALIRALMAQMPGLLQVACLDTAFHRGLPKVADRYAFRCICKLGWLGTELDAKANERGVPLISGSGGRVALYVLPTDEELMIGRHTLAMLMRRGRPF